MSCTSCGPPFLWLSPHAVQLAVPLGDDAQLMSCTSSGPPVLCLSTQVAQLTVPLDNGGQLMSCTYSGPLWLSTHWVHLTVPLGDDGQLMSCTSCGPPVPSLSTHAVQLTIPIGDDGQLMSCTSCGPPVLGLSTGAIQTFFRLRRALFRSSFACLFPAHLLYSPDTGRAERSEASEALPFVLLLRLSRSSAGFVWLSAGAFQGFLRQRRFFAFFFCMPLSRLSVVSVRRRESRAKCGERRATVRSFRVFPSSVVFARRRASRAKRGEQGATVCPLSFLFRCSVPFFYRSSIYSHCSLIQLLDTVLSGQQHRQGEKEYVAVYVLLKGPM